MKLYILGICGTFMAGVAILARELGFEVEGVAQTGISPLENVVVGEVLVRDSHPNADRLRSAITRNHNLRALVCSGYFDLATPYFATKYTIRHLGLDPSLRGNIRMTYYEAGHMMYTHKPSREKLGRDVADFYGWAMTGSTPTRNAEPAPSPAPPG